MTFDLETARKLIWDASERKIWTPPGTTGYGCDIDKHRHWQAIIEICDRQFPAALAEIERLRAEILTYQGNHCVDCCCARSWKALGIESYTGKSIPEEIEKLQHWVIKNRDIATELQYQLDDEVKETERLRAGAIKGNQFVNELMANCNSLRERVWKAEARIKELESSLGEAEALTKKNAETMNGYLARITELEDALVEGLTNFLHYRASCYDPARRCPYAKECDDCSTWDACGHVEKFRSEARQQLQAEGKIGPDATKMVDQTPNSAENMQKTGPNSPKMAVWQITEERVDALQDAIDRYDIYDRCLVTLKRKMQNVAVLRAMLREAE